MSAFCHTNIFMVGKAFWDAKTQVKTKKKLSTTYPVCQEKIKVYKTMNKDDLGKLSTKAKKDKVTKEFWIIYKEFMLQKLHDKFGEDNMAEFLRAILPPMCRFNKSFEPGQKGFAQIDAMRQRALINIFGEETNSRFLRMKSVLSAAAQQAAGWGTLLAVNQTTEDKVLLHTEHLYYAVGCKKLVRVEVDDVQLVK